MLLLRFLVHPFFYYELMVLLLLLWLTPKIIRWYISQPTAEIPPGSCGVPFIGETLQFMASIHSNIGFYDFVRIRTLRYGKCFRTNIFGKTHVFVSSTEAAKMILNNEMGKFTKKYIRSIGELVGDQSLLCASHENHRLLRNSLTDLFSLGSLSNFTRQFDELIVHTLSGWEEKGIVVILDEALKTTLRAMCKMLMSLENEEEVEMLQNDIALVGEAMLALPIKLPWTRFYKGLQARRRIMMTLEKIINQRRKGLGYNQDVLQQLLTDKVGGGYDESPSLTDAQIKDNILTMIIAGQDTTASAITWMVKYLDENQDVLRTLRAEQVSLAQKTSTNLFLTLEDLNQMRYASKVVKESLRMASIVPWFPRLSLQDCEIQGFKIRKGWNVNIDARSIHGDPTIYSDPNKFIPSRFDEETKPYSFLAFGTGGRTCLGINMAKAMMLVFLYRLTTTYKWKVIDSDPSIEKWAMFSRLRSGCPVSVTSINSTTSTS